MSRYLGALAFYYLLVSVASLAALLLGVLVAHCLKRLPRVRVRQIPDKDPELEEHEYISAETEFAIDELRAQLRSEREAMQ